MLFLVTSTQLQTYRQQSAQIGKFQFRRSDFKSLLDLKHTKHTICMGNSSKPSDFDFCVTLNPPQLLSHQNLKKKYHLRVCTTALAFFPGGEHSIADQIQFSSQFKLRASTMETTGDSGGFPTPWLWIEERASESCPWPSWATRRRRRIEEPCNAATPFGRMRSRPLP